MAANEDDAEIQQRVTAGRDVYAAGHDIIIGRPDAKPRTDEDTLAALVLKQAQEKRSRLIGTDVPGDATANVEYAQIPGRLNEPGGRDIGDLRSIGEYYRSLSPGRLVIIGAPGAGKTVLLLELQIRLLEERRGNPDAPIPVLVSASAYNTTDTWEDWLAGQISLEFSLRKRKAAALVSDGRILPMIDGLDEMDPAGDSGPERARALVRALNESMRGLERAPVVVTCRPGEYDRLARNGIERARHVELSPLTGTEAAAYLRKQLRTEDELASWTPVLETLEEDPDSPVAAELTTPWRLTLALATFRGGGDPARLLPPPGVTGGGYSAYVDDLLLDNYVHVAVSLRNKKARPYSEPNVRRWLTSLVGGLARHGRSATDLTLHEWRQPGETLTAQIPHAALMLLPFLAASLIGAFTQNNSVTNAAIVAVFALSVSGAFFPRTHSSRQISSRNTLTARANGLAAGFVIGLTTWLVNGLADGLTDGLTVGLMYGLIAGLANRLANRLTNGLAIGLATWLAYGLAAWLADGLAGGPAGGLTYGLAVGLTDGLVAGLIAGYTSRLTNFSPKTRTPKTIIRTYGLIGLAGGIAIGLATGLTNGLVIELSNKILTEISSKLSADSTNGLATGLAYGIAAWFAISARTWVRYHLVVAWDALRGRGPLRFGAFLDWAVRAGLLRESGISYQFRHRQLQDWLT